MHYTPLREGWTFFLWGQEPETVCLPHDFSIHGPRRPAAGIERPAFPARRIVHKPEGVPPQSAHLRIDHGQHGPGGRHDPG